MNDLEHLFRTYSDYVYRICMRYAHDSSEAQNLTQDVFVKIHGSIKTFRTGAHISTWIYRIAINHCIDHLRKERKREDLASVLNPLVVRNLTGCEDRELAAVDAWKILKSLKPQVRRILFLSLAEGLSYSEVAEVMGLTKDAVAKTVSRNLCKLQKKSRSEREEKIEGQRVGNFLKRSGV